MPYCTRHINPQVCHRGPDDSEAVPEAPPLSFHRVASTIPPLLLLLCQGLEVLPDAGHSTSAGGAVLLW